MGRTLALTSLLLLALGAAPHGAAAGVRSIAPSIDPHDPSIVQGNVVDCRKTPDKLICEFLRQAALVPYAGPKAAIARQVNMDGASGALSDLQAWVLDRPVAEPLQPASACTETDQCARAADAVCKAAGKGGVQSGSSKVVKDQSSGGNTCQAKCSTNDSVYVVCLGK